MADRDRPGRHGKKNKHDDEAVSHQEFERIGLPVFPHEEKSKSYCSTFIRSWWRRQETEDKSIIFMPTGDSPNDSCIDFHSDSPDNSRDKQTVIRSHDDHHHLHRLLLLPPMIGAYVTQEERMDEYNSF